MATKLTYFCTFLAILSALCQAAALLSPGWKQYEAKGSIVKNRPPVWILNVIPDLTGSKVTFLGAEGVALILLLIAALGHILSIIAERSLGYLRGIAYILNIASTFLILLGILNLLALYGNIMQMIYYGMMLILTAAVLSLFTVICARNDDDKPHVT